MPDRDRDGDVAPARPTEATAERLERRLTRERAIRREAEEISERATRALYDQQQRLLLLTSVANAANEASLLEPAIAIALEGIQEHCSWALGHAWLIDDHGLLVATSQWAGDIERFVELRDATRGLRLEVDRGLPGRVLRRREAVWIHDFSADGLLPRASAARRSGLSTAMAFPILAGGEVAGVLEFFSDHLQEPDPEQLGLFAQIGTELGRVAERRQAEIRLRHQATHDALTGLPNRTLIGAGLNDLLAQLEGEPERRPAVVFIDLDGFKQINDTLGHAAGDRVLIDVAERLSFVLEPGDTLGRLSGDEFVVLCDWSGEAWAPSAVAERVNMAMRQPFEYNGELFQLTASVGIAAVVPGGSGDELIAHADAAMYQAKAAGRGRHEVYTEELGAMLRSRTELERDLRHAVEREELELLYQPEIDLRDGSIVGVEALLRWHRDGTTVMPLDFIPMAEETGLIVPIGAWVLDSAVQQVRRWHEDTSIAAAPWVSVNLSVRQLADPNLVDDAREALLTHDVDPSNLILEVTESVILDDAEIGLTVLTELQRLGTEIAIDDFGTGYASLSYLARFPAHTLKIDRSFISRLDNARTRAIVAAMIELAHGLGLRAVAEGIETAEQLATLTELGCDLGQGYHFARPMTVAAVEKLMRTGASFPSLIGGPSSGALSATD